MTDADRRAIAALVRYLPAFESPTKELWTAGDPPDYSVTVRSFTNGSRQHANSVAPFQSRGVDSCSP